jgi:hypothetical protein
VQELNTNLTVNPLDGGFIEFHLAEHGKSASIPSKLAAIAASQFLAAANESFNRTGKPSPTGNEADFSYTIVTPRSLAFAPNPHPVEKATQLLILGFGDAHVGIALTPDAAIGLANTILANTRP